LIDQQATMLAYVDNFWLLGVAVLAMIPFVFLMKRVKPGSPIASPGCFFAGLKPCASTGKPY
ncbi:MAG: hypothetical protein WBP92_12900, partial [Candidatus Acidiferrales bacterium]